MAPPTDEQRREQRDVCSWYLNGTSQNFLGPLGQGRLAFVPCA